MTEMAAYQRVGIPHHRLLDPDEGALVVMRDTPEGYLNVLGATRGEKVRAGPFDAIDLEVGELLCDDPADDPEPSPTT